jgi:hypothetical protein
MPKMPRTELLSNVPMKIFEERSQDGHDTKAAARLDLAK